MRIYDLSPLYRSFVGFDRLAPALEKLLRADSGNSYPPYNIELVDEDRYRITLAVAGFTESDLDIEVNRDLLEIRGERDQHQEEARYLYRGIDQQSFERRFQLADHVRVESAKLENGLLTIALVRELPEAMKPRRIAISSEQSDQSERLERPASGQGEADAEVQEKAS